MGIAERGFEANTGEIHKCIFFHFHFNKTPKTTMAAVTENNETTATPSPVKAVPVKEVPTESGDKVTNGAEEKVVEKATNGSSEEKVVANGAKEEEVKENGHSKENGTTNGTNGVAKDASPAKEAEKRS